MNEQYHLDEPIHKNLRPSNLNHFIGQKNIKENLRIFIKGAIDRNETLDHILFSGPPGLGKTTLANIVANEMNSSLRISSGPVISKTGEIAALLSTIQEGEVLFIDEIHRLAPNVEEVLYSAMEDFHLDLIIGEGPTARSVRINLPRFTLIGATTRTDLLTTPLHDRFGILLRLEYYSTEELTAVVKRAAHILETDINEEGSREIASRARGTPRIANRLLRRVRDFAQKNFNPIDKKIADIALSQMGIDKNGFNTIDRKYLVILNEVYANTPVGLNTIAAALSESKETISNSIEPYLLRKGLIIRTPRGRIINKAAKKLLKT